MNLNTKNSFNYFPSVSGPTANLVFKNNNLVFNQYKPQI